MADSLENQYDNDKFVDYYKILDVDMEANVEEIKKKYIELAKKYHPDQKNGNTEMFQLVSKAYETLSNKETRKEYDLYFLKKSVDELQEDTFFSLKDQYNDFLLSSENKKKLTKEELDKIYDDVFKDKETFLEKKLDLEETNRRINDINFEREATNIESMDEQLKNILDSNPDLKVEDVLEYIKEINKDSSTEIVTQEFGTLDTIPGYFDNCASFLDETQNVPNSFFSMLDTNNVNSRDQVKNFDLENFNVWKNNKKSDSRLDSDTIETFLIKRRQEEQELLEDVEESLITNIKKRTDVETFLKTKNHINNDDVVKVSTINNVKKRTF
jgi:curved DNA-binding protein CbpA